MKFTKVVKFLEETGQIIILGLISSKKVDQIARENDEGRLIPEKK